MGLLDDAIREHLELKRRRGADTGEVSREEQEALGPARRTAEPLAPPGAEPLAAREPVAPAEREPVPFSEHDVWEHEPSASPLPPEPEHPTPGGSRPTVAFDAQHAEEPPPAPAPAPAPNPFETPRPVPAAPDAALPPAPPHQQDPLADHEPDIVPVDEEPEGEDLLEETPEFLEETPEHDRLWFEQRPPRDFDFGN